MYWGGGGGLLIRYMSWWLFCLKGFNKNKKASEQKTQHFERVCMVCVCVCVCVCARARALDREGTWVYSSVSTALVVVNTDSFVSDRLQ